MRTPKWTPHEQGSVGWLKEKCGCLSASKMAYAMDFLKNGKEGAARKKLKAELVAERMTDISVGHFVTPAMEFGLLQEPYAKERYEEVTGNFITPCGFALHSTIPFFGASPDGLIGEEGLIEVKCPETTTYVAWRMDGVVPEQHHPQLLAQLAVTGRKWTDFFAFDPRVKGEAHQHFLRRYEPKEEEISAVEEAARQFLAEVEELFDKVTQEEE
jgi:predicted phage-related endonuclease